MGDNIKILVEYLERRGLSYEIDDNPSPEKIERIKRSIERRVEIEKHLKEKYNNNMPS